MAITKRIVSSQREEFGTGHPAPLQIRLDAVLEYGTPEESIVFDDHRGYNKLDVVVWQESNADYPSLSLELQLEGAVENATKYFLTSITEDALASSEAGESAALAVDAFGLPVIKAVLTWSGTGLPSTEDTSKADPTGGVLLTFYA